MKFVIPGAKEKKKTSVPGGCSKSKRQGFREKIILIMSQNTGDKTDLNLQLQAIMGEMRRFLREEFEQI